MPNFYLGLRSRAENGEGGRRSRGGGQVLREGDRNVFGEVARNLPLSQLPLNKDIGLQVIRFEQFEGLTRDESVKRTAKEVEELYMKSSIPTIANTSIERKIRRLMQMKREKEISELEDKRTGKSRDQGDTRKKKKNHKVKVKLQDVVEDIFEVKTEVPDLEKTFYEDQCGPRKMYIGDVDEKETRRLGQEAMKRKKKEGWANIAKDRHDRMKGKENKEMKKYKRVKWSENDEEECKEDDEKDDRSFKVCDDRSRKKVYHSNTERERLMWSCDEEDNLEDFLETCDRFKVSETAASSLFNLASKKLKLSQSQVNKKKKKFRLKK